MSAEEEVDSKKKKHVDKSSDKSTPVPVDAAFAGWIESLFRDDERADVLTVQQLFGRHGRTLGEIIKRHHFPLGERPSKDQIVSVSNELYGEMQNEADTFRKPMLYAVTAYNTKKSAGNGEGQRAGGGGFARRTIEVTPRTARLVKPGDDDGDDDGDPLTSGDVLHARIKTVLQDGRFYAEHVTATFGGYMELSLDIIKELRADAREARAAWLEATRARNEAENNALDRDIARMEKKFWLDQKQRGMNFIFGTAMPQAMAAISGKIGGNGVNEERKTIEMVISENLDGADRDRIFGRWSDDGDCINVGILSEEQVRLIVSVKDGKSPIEDLDGLIIGPNAVTQEQQNALVADLEKLMPFLLILKKRREKIEAAQAASK